MKALGESHMLRAMRLNDLENEAALDALISSGALFVAYCSTPTCNVCKVLRPKVDAVLERHDIGGVYVDTTAHPEVAGQRLLFSVPSVIVFADGRELQRFGRHISLAEFEAFLVRMQTLMA